MSYKQAGDSTLTTGRVIPPQRRKTMKLDIKTTYKLEENDYVLATSHEDYDNTIAIHSLGGFTINMNVDQARDLLVNLKRAIRNIEDAS